MEALLGVFLLHLEPSCAARLLYLFRLSNEPHPLVVGNSPASLSDRLAVATRSASQWDAQQSWVPMLMQERYRGIDPYFARADPTSAAKRHADVESMISESLARPPKGAENQQGQQQQHQQEQLAGQSGFANFSQVMDDKRLQLAQLETILGYKFRRINILMQATTHASSLQSFHFGCYQR